MEMQRRRCPAAGRAPPRGPSRPFQEIAPWHVPIHLGCSFMFTNTVQRHLHTLHCSDASSASRLHAAEGVVDSIKAGIGAHLEDTPEHHDVARSIVAYALTNLSKASAVLKVLPDANCVTQDALPFALKSRPWAVLETILTAAPDVVLLSALQGMEWSLIKPASQMLQFCSALLGQEQQHVPAMERIGIINSCLQRLLSCLKSTCIPDVTSAARLLGCACSLLAHSSCYAVLKCIELCARTFELSCRRTLHSKRAFTIACEETLLPCSKVLLGIQRSGIDSAAPVAHCIRAALQAALFAASPASNFLFALLKLQAPAESHDFPHKKRKLAVEIDKQRDLVHLDAKGASAAAGDAYQGLLFKVLSDGLQDASSPGTVMSSCIGVATIFDLFGQQVSVQYETCLGAVNPQQLVDVLACRRLCMSLVAVLEQRAAPDIVNAAALAAGSLFQSASTHRLYRAFPPHSLDGYADCMRLVLASMKTTVYPLDGARELLPGVFRFLQGVVKMDAAMLLQELPWILLICSAALHQESPLSTASAAASTLRSICACCTSLYRFDSLIKAASQILTDQPMQRVHSGSDEWSNCIAACIVSTRDAQVISTCIGFLCDHIASESTPDLSASSLCTLLQTIVCCSADVRATCIIDDCSPRLISAIRSLFARGGKNFAKSLSTGSASCERQLCVSAAMQLLAQSVIARVDLHGVFPAGGSSMLQPFVENPFAIDFSELSRFVSASCDPVKGSSILSHLILASVAIQCAAVLVADVLCRLPPGISPPTESISLYASSSGLANSALSVASHIRKCKFAALPVHYRDASANGELERSVWQLIQARLRTLCDFCSDCSLTHIWTEILSHVAGGCVSAHVQHLLCDPYFYDISSLRVAALQGVKLFVRQQMSVGKSCQDACNHVEIFHVCSFVASLPSGYIDDHSVHDLILLNLELAGRHFIPIDVTLSAKSKDKSSQGAAVKHSRFLGHASSAALICSAASLVHACPPAARLGFADRTFHTFFSTALDFFCAEVAPGNSEAQTSCCCLLQRLSSVAVQHYDSVVPDKDLDFFDFLIPRLFSSSSLVCSQFALSILQGVDCHASSRALPSAFRALSPLSEKHLLVAWSHNQSVAHLHQIAQCLAIRRRLQVSDGCGPLITSLPLFLAHCIETCSQQQRPSLDQATHVASFLCEYVQMFPSLEPEPRPAVLLTVFGIAAVLEHDHTGSGIRIINSILSCGIHSTAATLLKATMSLLNPSRIPLDEAFSSSCSRIFSAIYSGPRWQQRLRTLEKSVDAVIHLCGGAAVSCCTSRKFDSASVFMTSLASVLTGSQSLAVPLSALRFALDCSLAVFQQLCAYAASDADASSVLAVSACSWMYVIMTHIIHSSDTVKDCAPAVVHALVTLLGAICRLHSSVADVAGAARSWARFCEALVSVHLKAVVKQYITVAIETWLRLRSSLLIPMELLQPLEAGVLALVSCCDKKQIQQIHACSSAAVRTLLRDLVQLHDTSYKYTGIA